MVGRRLASFVMLLLALAAFSWLDASSQAKRPPAGRATPTRKLRIRTEVQRLARPDGKTVVLYADSTWTLDASAPAAGRLDVQAALVLGSGDSRPMARLAIYVLDANVEDTLRVIDSVTKDDLVASTLGHWYMLASVMDHGAVLDQEKPYATGILPFIAVHEVRSTRTGFDGKAVLDSIPPGSYFLVASREVGRQKVVWNLPITVKSGREDIVLENSNAVYLR